MKVIIDVEEYCEGHYEIKENFSNREGCLVISKRDCQPLDDNIRLTKENKPIKKLNWEKAKKEIEEKIEYVPTYREAVLIRDIIEIINNNINKANGKGWIIETKTAREELKELQEKNNEM